MLQCREKSPAYKKGKGISMGGRLASGVMLTEAPRKGELWTVLVVRQYLIFFLRRRVKVRGTVLKKVLCWNLQQFNLKIVICTYLHGLSELISWFWTMVLHACRFVDWK
jgi:hypothetical protein